ncbi:MAG: histidine kinase [Mycobacteriales bacterium]
MAEETARSGVGDPPQRGRVGYLLRKATEALVERGSDRDDSDSRLRALLVAVLSISEDLSIAAMIERVLDAACELAGGTGGALAVLSQDGRTVVDVVSTGLGPEQVEALRTGIPPASALAVPVRTRNRLFGTRYVAHKKGAGAFTETDELMVVALASAAGVALQNAQLFEAQERRGLWLVASSEVRQAVLGGVQADRLAEMIVGEARQAARAVFTALLVPSPAGGVVVSASTEPSMVGLELAAGTSYAERVIRHRAPVVLESLDQSPKLAAVPGDVGARSGQSVIAPLGVAEAGDSLGALLVVYPRSDGGVAGLNLDYVVGFAGQAGIALQLAATQRDRERIAVLEDRERIARDLHDLVIQRLFAAGMTLQSTDPLIGNDTARGRLAAVADDLDGTIRELRQEISQLQPPGLAVDFRGDVQQVVDRAVAGSEIKVRTHYIGAAGSLISDQIRPQVLAVLGEALSNAVRHAGAATIDVTVGIEDEKVSVVVDDDGRGLDPAVSRRSGLANLESRASALGGGVTLTTGSRGVGTRVTWSVPA